MCTNTCGNNVKNSTEACDDGNNANNDGCSSACQIENTLGYVCEDEPNGSQFRSACTATCGNGVRGPSE